MSIIFCIFSTTRVSRAAAAAGQGIEVSPSSPCRRPFPVDGEEELAEPPPPERAPVPAVAAGTTTSIRCKSFTPLHPRRPREDPQAALLVDILTLAALRLEQVRANKSTSLISKLGGCSRMSCTAGREAANLSPSRTSYINRKRGGRSILPSTTGAQQHNRSFCPRIFVCLYSVTGNLSLAFPGAIHPTSS